MRIFASRRRTDRTPRKANETIFAFLDRTGATYYEPVRDLLESWIDRVPESHRSSLVSALSDSDAKFDSAFWEMYVYTVSTSLGLEVEIHPDVPGTAKHPDFLVHDDVPYYLEAVSVGHRPEALARDRRRAEVEAVLDRMTAQDVTLNFEHHQIGTRPISADRLGKELKSWLASPEIQSASWRSQAQKIGAARPTKYYEDDGWLLKFEAIPTKGEGPLVGVRGPGRAQGVNNVEHLRRVLDAKVNRYGSNLPHPLVSAVLSNTDYETRLFEVSEALYGTSSSSPSEDPPDHLQVEGHWRTANGWRRSHNPTVVVAAGLNVHNLAVRTPTSWSTLDPMATTVNIAWADPIMVSGTGPQSGRRSPALAALGIDEFWCSGRPDFV